MTDPERLPLAAVREGQWERVRALVRAGLEGNAFLRARWAAAGVRAVDDLPGWDDFRRLPLTRKADFAADQAAHPPFGSNLTYPLERYVRAHQTSGTTGTPIRWLDTDASWRWWERCW